MFEVLTSNLVIMRKVVYMGIILLLYIITRFITFESEIGYDECIKMKEFQFGEDLLHIEPGQDKGSIPTSVLIDIILFIIDNINCLKHFS